MSNPSGKSLYERLGGYDALAAAVDDLLPRLHADPQIGVYWRGQNTQTKRRGRQMVLDFLVQAFGGPAAHTGLFRETLVRRLAWLDDRDFMDLVAATSVIPSGRL